MSAALNAAASRSRQLFLLFAAVVVAVTLSARHGSQGATTYEVVHAFSGEESSSRSSLVAGPDGRLFGTVANGGQFGQGALYAAQRQPDGTLTVQTLHEFTGPDGTSLSGGLTVAPDGRLYGTSFNGGALGFGSVFAFDPVSGAVEVMASFTSVNGNPNTGVIVGSDGALYGGAGSQRIFQLTTAGTLSILATFTPATHGLGPRSPIAEAVDGNLYVATASGGPNSRGVILRVPRTGGLTPIFAFTAATGSPAAGLLRATDGYLYGATNSGGTSGGGILFRLDLNGAFETLHNFSPATGTNPGGALIEAADGFLYGSTTSGGSAGRGAIFRIAQGSIPSFTVVQPLQASFGSIDSPLMQTVHGDFYATTAAQFSTAGGILRMPAASDSVARVHTFTRSAIKQPVGLPSRAGDGSLFGASLQGGTDDAGTIYKIDPGGGASVVRSATFGATPTSGVLLADDGRLYGTAANGRSVYRVNVDGSGYTVLFTLPGFSGTTSNGGLIQTADGAIWGSAMFGGTLAHGLIFRIAPTGAVAVVHEFPGGAGGMRPGSELLAASDGFLYGTTVGDQTTSRGTVYRIDSLGTVTTLHSFGGPDGSTPFGGLAEGPDGVLYGMTNGGGTFNRGVLFKVAGGVVTKVLDLTSTTGGAPRGSLTRSSDGRLYGLTQSGGAFNGGTLIRFNVATGQLRVLHDLPAGTISLERLFEPTGQNALMGVEVFGPKRGGAIFRFTPDRPPAGGADTFTTAEDTALSISAPGVLGNDIDEGSSLTAALVTPPPAAHGSVTLNPNGSFTFTPAPNFHGTTTFTYTAADALDTSDPVTVSIEVTAVNDAPTVASASLTTDEDTPALGVAGWTDIDDTAVSFRIGTNGTRGTATIDANSGAFIYTPNPNVHGADSFTILGSDGEVDSAAATITVAITSVNDAPLAAPQSVVTAEEVTNLVALAGTDVDGDPLTFVVGQAFKGTVILSGSAATYVPLANFHGSDSFTYSVSDGQLSSAAAVTITVTAVNDAPIAAGQSVSTVEDRPVALTVWASDLEGQTLSYAIVAAPANGSLSGTAPNFVYTPANNFRGTDSFTFKVNDGALDSATATVSIAVTDEQFVLASPEGASVQALAVNRVNPSILYAGAQRGFARSVDGGATWHRSTVRFEVSSIVVHPTTPTTLFSAGFDFGRVRRSTDGGATWQSLNAPGGRLLLVDPSRPDTLYAFGFEPTAVSKTTNGGASWTSSASGLSANGQISVSGAAIDPAVPSRLFVSLGNGGGIFRSTDSAASWQQVGFAGSGANDVDVDPRGTGVVYAVASGRVRRSPDAGNSWVDVHAGITGSAVGADVGPDGAVYVTTSAGGVWVSTTGTGGWVRHANTLPGTFVNVVVADPTSVGTVYAANSAHLYKSTDATQTWTVAETGLSTLSPWAVLVTEADPGVVFTATNSGVFKSDNGGSSWSPTLAATSRTNAALAQDPVDPQVLYMGESDNVRVHRTLDGGATWTGHTTGLGPNATILSLAVDASGGVYAGVGTGGVYKSTDRGASWAQANSGLPSASVFAVAATNTTPAVLYAGTTNGLFRSTDGAATWQSLTSGIGGFVRSVAVDPSNPNVVYAVVTGGATGAYKSVNGGDTWTQLPLSLGSSGFVAIVVDPANTSTVYAATTGAQGVARSVNGGASWQTMTAGLPLTEIVSLGIGSDSSLYAGLITGGLWKNVRAANDAPIALNQSVSTLEDTPKTVTLTGTDVDGQPLTFIVTGAPSHGTLTGTAPTLTYTPAPNYNGPDSFRFTATDGIDASNEATISIAVTAVNDVPTAAADAFTTAEDTPLTVPAPGVLINDTDGDGQALGAVLATGPAHGTLTLRPDGSFIYTPAANYSGPDGFTYRASDDTSSSAVATVSIDVTAANDAPVALNGTLSATEDTVASGTLVAADIDGPSLTYRIAARPTKGRLDLNPATGAFTFTPNRNATGGELFTFTASDGSATSAAASVVVTIAPVNDAPVAHTRSLSVLEDDRTVIQLGGSDVDRDALSYVIVNQPVRGTLSAAGPQVTYTPPGNYTGVDSFTFRVNDGTADSGIATIHLNVTSRHWTSYGPDGGNVIALALDPSDPSVIFAAAEEGGVYKTINAGAEWTRSNTGLGNLNIGAFAIDSSRPSTLYAIGRFSGGAFRSVDGGATWSRVNLGIPNASIAVMAMGSGSPNPVYAGGTGLFKSTDGGTTWTASGTGLPVGGSVTAIVVHPVESTLLYAVVSGTVFRSTDSGATWNGVGLKPGVFGGVAIDPVAPTRVVAWTFGELFVTTDGGTTWTPSTRSFFFLNAVAIDPVTAGIFVADGSGLVKSLDAGASWTSVLQGTANAFAFDPLAPNTLYAGVDVDGVRKTSDGGATWSVSNTGLSAMLVYAVTADPSMPTTVYAGVLGERVYKSVDGGKAWSISSSGIPARANSIITSLAVHPTDSATVYAGDDGVFKTTNGGTTWIRVSPVGFRSVLALAIDPANPATVYAGSFDSQGVLKTTDGGVSWTPMNAGLTNLTIWSLAIDPSTPATVFAGTSGGVFKSIDGGLSWSSSSANATFAIAIDPATPTTLYAGSSGGRVFKSTDSGANWLPSPFPLSGSNVRGLAIDPASTASVYAATESDGIFRTTDAGATWQSVADGMDRFLTYGVAVAPGNPSVVYAGTYGGGVMVLRAAADDPPRSNGLTVTTLEDVAASIALTAVDPDGDALTYSVVAGPSHGTLSGTAPNLTYTPNANYQGPDSFTFTASNGGGSSAPATVDISVTPANDIPVSANDAYATAEDTPLNVAAPGVLANDTDVDGDPLQAMLVSGPSHGTVTLNTNGSFLYTPAANYHGPDSFTVKANDGTIDSAVASVNITVTPVNDAPVASNASGSTAEDTPVGISLSAIDVEGAPLTLTIVDAPAHGTLTGTGANRTYMPAANYFGPDSFTFTASDGTDASNVATVAIAVAAVNDPPTVQNGSLSTAEDVSGSGTLSGLDVDGPALTFEIVTNGTKGTATITNAASGAFSYVPRANLNGPDSFTFKVSDGTTQSSVATVAVTIGAVNDPPVVRVGVVATEELVSVTGRLAAEDAEGDPITFSITAQPLHGVVTITDSSTGEFSYAPNVGTIGYQPFTFTASDGTASTIASQMVFVAANSARWPGQTVRASVGTGGAQLAGGFRGSASADGRLIAFVTPNRRILVHDRQTLATVEASVSTTGAPANSAGSDNPATSADGGFVAFDSDATNLVASDTNGNVDVFVRDLGTGQTVRVSVASDGSQGNGPSFRPAISADGRYVAFVSRATNLVPADTNGQDDVFVYDRATSMLRRVSIATDGAQADNLLLCGTSSDGSFPCISISADGRYVSFASFASTLVPGDTNGFMDAFVHDLASGETTRVSLASGGGQALRGGDSPMLSADGRFVVFASDSASLDPSSTDTNNDTDIFLHDRVTSVTRRVSLADNGSQPNGSSLLPSINAGGRYVSFNSDATNLVAGDTNALRDTFVRDVAAGRTIRVSVAGDGQSGEQRVRGAAAITADGRFVAFWSDAANFVTGDSNAFSDVFVVGGVTVTPTSVTIAQSGGSGAVNVSFVYPGTAWSAVSNAAWITVTNQSHTLGSGSVTFAVARNNGPARTGTLTVAGQTITLSQPSDTTAPTVSYTISPAANAIGWNNTNVTITGTGSDLESDVTSITCSGASSAFTGAQQISFLWSTEGTTTLTCLATNGAGLSASVSFPVRVDKTPPELTITTPSAVTYALHQVVKAAFQCADPISGFTTCQSTVPFDAPIDTATAGSKSFTVSTTDAAGNPASRTVAYTVAKGTPQVTVTGGTFVYNANPRLASGSAKGVLDEPLGPVTFTYNGVATPPVNAGTFAVVASYAGNANYLAGSATTTIVINKASTTVLLISTPQPSSFSQPVTLVATVSPVQPGAGAPTGMVQFFDGGVALGSAAVQGNGQAMLTTSGLSAGSHTLTASYSGDGNFVGTTGVPRIHSVLSQTASTQTALSASPTPSSLNQAVVLTAVVNPISGTARPTGNVRFYDGSTQLGTATIVRVGGNNQAQLSVSTLALGTHTLTAEYVGDGTMAASMSAPTGHTVYQGTAPTATTTTVSSSPNPSTAGQTVTLNATVTAGRRSQATGTVLFYVNGVSVGSAVTNASGQASLPVSGLAIGSHAITAQYVGNATFAGSTGSWRHFVQ